MNAAALLKSIDQAGIHLDLGDNGALDCTGDQAAIAQWLPMIPEHKAELTALLASAANDARRLWLITRPDGSRFSLSRTPPGTLAEIQRDYPGARIEPEPDPAPGPAPSTNEEPQ